MFDQVARYSFWVNVSVTFESTSVMSLLFHVFNKVHIYGTPEETFLFQYLPEKKSKQKELERKSKQ